MPALRLPIEYFVLIIDRNSKLAPPLAAASADHRNRIFCGIPIHEFMPVIVGCNCRRANLLHAQGSEFDLGCAHQRSCRLNAAVCHAHVARPDRAGASLRFITRPSASPFGPPSAMPLEFNAVRRPR